MYIVSCGSGGGGHIVDTFESPVVGFISDHLLDVFNSSLFPLLAPWAHTHFQVSKLVIVSSVDVEF